jgi:hypothetical protein
MGWATRVVAAGALTGIVTALFGALLGQTRTYVTMGRQHLLPAWLVSMKDQLCKHCCARSALVREDKRPHLVFWILPLGVLDSLPRSHHYTATGYYTIT